MKSVFMNLRVQVNTFILCLICVDATVRKDEYRRDGNWGGGVGDKWNSRSYWKADVSILVNISFPHRQISQLGFLFNELLFLHTSNKMVVQ